MARPTLENTINYRTTREAYQLLHLSRAQFELRIERHVFLPPTFIDNHGNKFFSNEWIDHARRIQEAKIQGTAETVP